MTVPTVAFATLGCRLNQSEIDSMARQFAAQGHDITDSAEDASLFVVNTCAVTQEATRSSRQLIYRLHRANPDAQIAVTGCYAHLSPDEIERLIMEAETSVEKDQETRELIMQKNRLDNMIKNARKAMAEYGRSFSPEEQQEILRILNNAEESLSTNDGDELKHIGTKVEETASRITAAMLTTV